MITNMYPYLRFNGNGQEAVSFYAEALQAEVIEVKRFGDMPANPQFPLPDAAKERILNAHLKAGSFDLMLSDILPGQPFEAGSGITLAIILSNAEATQIVFAKLQDSGRVLMPLQPTFWSPLYGQVVDKFGVTWQISTN